MAYDPEQRQKNIDAHKPTTPEAERQRQQLRAAIDFKNYAHMDWSRFPCHA